MKFQSSPSRVAVVLGPGEQSEDFPFEKPGPDHLRRFTASAALATYYALLETRDRARDAVERNEADLFEEWQERQDRVTAEASPLR